MRTREHHSKPGICRRRGEIRRAQSGFTLVEIMVTSMVALIIIGALLSSYMYGMKMMEMVKPKLASSDEARHTISKIVHEVRSAASIQVGTGSETRFTAAPLNARQEGNAIQIYPSAEITNFFIRYFRDPNDDTLRRLTSSDEEPLTLARDVTNAVPFTAEDFAGNILTNRTNNRVIGLYLQFSQIPYTTGKAGPGSLYDYYQLRTRITRRAIF